MQGQRECAYFFVVTGEQLLVGFTAAMVIGALVNVGRRSSAGAFATKTAMLGLAFEHEDRAALQELPLPLFRQGGARSVGLVAVGTYRGDPMKIFRYSYKTGSGRSAQWHYFLCALTRVSGTLPTMSISDRGALGGIGETFGTATAAMADFARDGLVPKARVSLGVSVFIGGVGGGTFALTETGWTKFSEHRLVSARGDAVVLSEGNGPIAATAWLRTGTQEERLTDPRHEGAHALGFTSNGNALVYRIRERGELVEYQGTTVVRVQVADYCVLEASAWWRSAHTAATR